MSRYVYSMELNVENPMMPSSGPAMTLRAHQTQTILSAAAEGIQAGVVIDSSEMTMGIPGAGPAPDLSGTTLTFEMGPRGQVWNVAADGDADEMAAEVATGIFEGLDYFRLPETEVAAEDSWTESVPVDLSLGGAAQTVEVEFTYTFAGLEDSEATITFTGPVASTLDMGGMPANISGELTGSMVVDLAEGRYVRQDNRMSLEMVVAGMAVPMDLTTALELVSEPS
ncbi:DUF6263 family protein [Candidatus Palauibacter sp.]|uniref:DUF6263 family protein n=1 Tax=Candidatus Palauibacter sp. TaxID=3101350 RepID=UPI003B524CEB